MGVKAGPLDTLNQYSFEVAYRPSHLIRSAEHPERLQGDEAALQRKPSGEERHAGCRKPRFNNAAHFSAPLSDYPGPEPMATGKCSSRLIFTDALTRSSWANCPASLSPGREGSEIGILALTKVEFIEPDICDYRYWYWGPSDEVVKRLFEVWFQINLI